MRAAPVSSVDPCLTHIFNGGSDRVSRVDFTLVLDAPISGVADATEFGEQSRPVYESATGGRSEIASTPVLGRVGPHGHLSLGQTTEILQVGMQEIGRDLS